MTDDIAAENRLLRILAEGCRAHPAYRARRAPGVAGCAACERMHEARRALDALERGRAAQAG